MTSNSLMQPDTRSDEGCSASISGIPVVRRPPALRMEELYPNKAGHLYCADGVGSSSRELLKAMPFLG